MGVVHIEEPALVSLAARPRGAIIKSVIHTRKLRAKRSIRAVEAKLSSGFPRNTALQVQFAAEHSIGRGVGILVLWFRRGSMRYK
jgi:hypothetical protein